MKKKVARMFKLKFLIKICDLKYNLYMVYMLAGCWDDRTVLFFYAEQPFFPNSHFRNRAFGAFMYGFVWRLWTWICGKMSHNQNYCKSPKVNNGLLRGRTVYEGNGQ